jgi:hypothetical protein
MSTPSLPTALLGALTSFAELKALLEAPAPGGAASALQLQGAVNAAL